ncbi:hypothetical protein OG552_10675 [Streptomyces sp. NBC_01476]|uniref:hypothetical protein n=1 Tax=Streptomyces sp. NBC_01476 TaxID=2903881 RepID=UPI002E2F0666|nr:hypothetical protein [Streptomyces sp. NBC_01476]
MTTATGSRVRLDTEPEVRAFLKLCLDPGPGFPKRTVAKLAKVMPDWLRGPLAIHAPDLAELRAEAVRLRAEAERADRAYVKALGAWIAKSDQEDPS